MYRLSSSHSIFIRVWYAGFGWRRQIGGIGQQIRVGEREIRVSQLKHRQAVQ